MQNKTLFQLILAALCYTAPFVFPQSCFFLIFFFPFFIFSAIREQHISFRAIFWWCFIITSIHLLPLNDALLFMASGPLYLRIIPPFFLIFYVMLYPASWLMTIRFIFQAKWCTTRSKKLFVWTCGLWCYLLIIEHALLWPFGRQEGYIFMNPLLPLVTNPFFCGLISAIPFCIILLWFCFITSTITATIISRTKKWVALLGLALLPGIIFVNPSAKLPSWLTTIGHLPLLLPNSIPIETGTKILQYELDQLHHLHPSIQTVIMPESSWNGTALHHHNYIAEFNHPIQNVIIGSFAQKNSAICYNRIYYFKDGTLASHHDKRHAVPLTERPLYFATTLSHSLFFTGSTPTIPAPKARQPLYVPTIGPLVPYVCSEIFCNTKPDDFFDTPILALVNDWWFQLPHFQKLMVLAARLRAITWHRPLLYISFHYAHFFDPSGHSAEIATTPPDRLIH